MLTGEYETETPPPGCVWENKEIESRFDLERAYRNGWLVFERFIDGSHGREVTSEFPLSQVWRANTEGGYRFVCREPVDVTRAPDGLEPFPNKQMVYIGKGPLIEDRQVLLESEADEDPLWMHGAWLRGWLHCGCCGDSPTAHYAVDPTTRYARINWPEHVAAWERAQPNKNGRVYCVDSVSTLVDTPPYKDPRKVPDGVEPLPEDQPNLAYVGLAPLPERKQVTYERFAEDVNNLWACWPAGCNKWSSGVCGTVALCGFGKCHLAVNTDSDYARRHFPELVKNMQTKHVLEKLDACISKSMQGYIGQRVSKDLQDSMVKEMLDFNPKFPTMFGMDPDKGTSLDQDWTKQRAGRGSYDILVPGRCMGKSLFVCQEYIKQVLKAKLDLPEPLVCQTTEPEHALDPHSEYARKHWPELYTGATSKPITPEMVLEASKGCYGSPPVTEWQSMMVADGLNRELDLS